LSTPPNPKTNDPSIKPPVKPPIAPATPVEFSPTPPPLLRVLFQCVVWWVLLVGHFLLCGRLAYSIGHPDLIPGWLEWLDELLQHGLSAAVDLLLLLLWWCLVIVLYFPVWFLADLVNRFTAPASAFERPHGSKAPTPTEEAPVQAMLALTPMIAMSLLSLLILPAEAPNHYEFESGMEMANQLTYAGFVEHQYLSIVAMIVIFALAAGFCLGVWLVMTFYPEGGIPTFLMVILFAIAVSMAVGLGLGPILGALPERFGAYQATAMLLGGVTLALSPPTLLILRQIDKKKPV
jgi:hypothetical protein